MAKFSINRWRKKAISLYGRSRGLTKEQRSKVTEAVHGRGSRSAPKSTTRSEKPTARRRRRASSRKGRGGGKRPFGNVGWKGMLAGLASMTLIRLGIRKAFGAVPAEYVDSASLVGAGLIGKAAKIGTAHLLTPGIILGGSKIIEDIFSPGGYYTLGGVGNAGGYDF